MILAWEDSAEPVAAYLYLAYGKLYSDLSDFYGASTLYDPYVFDCPILYAGQYYDYETGLYYLRARYYSPDLCRFTSEDPIKDGLNWYAYCAGNPVMFYDPWGLAYYDKDGNLRYDNWEYIDDKKEPIEVQPIISISIPAIDRKWDSGLVKITIGITQGYNLTIGEGGIITIFSETSGDKFTIGIKEIIEGTSLSIYGGLCETGISVENENIGISYETFFNFDTYGDTLTAKITIDGFNSDLYIKREIDTKGAMCVVVCALAIFVPELLPVVVPKLATALA